MEAELEDAGPLEKKLSITVPAKQVESRFAVAYRELRREVELPGFRKGKVPRKVLEQRFGVGGLEEKRSRKGEDDAG